MPGHTVDLLSARCREETQFGDIHHNRSNTDPRSYTLRVSCLASRGEFGRRADYVFDSSSGFVSHARIDRRFILGLLIIGVRRGRLEWSTLRLILTGGGDDAAACRLDIALDLCQPGRRRARARDDLRHIDKRLASQGDGAECERRHRARERSPFRPRWPRGSPPSTRSIESRSSCCAASSAEANATRRVKSHCAVHHTVAAGLGATG